MFQRQKCPPPSSPELFPVAVDIFARNCILAALMDETQELKSYRFCRFVQCYFSSLFRLPPVPLSRRMKVGMGTVRAMECGLPQPCHFDRVNTL